MLERRKQQVQTPADLGCGRDLRADHQGRAALPSPREPRRPFPLPAVEDQDRIAGLEPQYIGQIIGLLPVEQDLCPAASGA